MEHRKWILEVGGIRCLQKSENLIQLSFPYSRSRNRLWNLNMYQWHVAAVLKVRRTPRYFWESTMSALSQIIAVSHAGLEYFRGYRIWAISTNCMQVWVSSSLLLQIKKRFTHILNTASLSTVIIGLGKYDYFS